MEDIKYSSYTDAQKRATKKYRENNKEKVNEQRKKYYLNRKEKDPNFLQYKRIKAKEYYQKKKALIKAKNEAEIKKVEEELKKAEPIPLVEPIVEPVIEPVIEPVSIIIHPLIDETIKEKKKRKYNKKQKLI
jgi:hypothetical protein